MKVKIKVPFFIRFEELEELIKKKFGKEYEIVDLFRDKNGEWQVVIEKIDQKKKKILLDPLAMLKAKIFILVTFLDELARITGEKPSVILLRSLMLIKGDLSLPEKPEIKGGVRNMVNLAKKMNSEN